MSVTQQQLEPPLLFLVCEDTGRCSKEYLKEKDVGAIKGVQDPIWAHPSWMVVVVIYKSMTCLKFLNSFFNQCCKFPGALFPRLNSIKTMMALAVTDV